MRARKRVPRVPKPRLGVEGVDGYAVNMVSSAVTPSSGEDTDAFENPLEQGLGRALAGGAYRGASRRTGDQRDLEASTIGTGGDSAFHWRLYHLKAIRLRDQVKSYEESVFDEAPWGNCDQG